jgi:hypothetical protein
VTVFFHDDFLNKNLDFFKKNEMNSVKRTTLIMTPRPSLLKE